MAAPLSGQVLAWPVDPEENAVTNKEGQELKKNRAKVGCQERTVTKFSLSCKNSDGRTRTLLLGQPGVSERPFPESPLSVGGRQQLLTCTLARMQWWARDWVGVASL